MNNHEHPEVRREGDDPVWDALKRQPSMDLEPWRRENIRLLARAELGRESRGGSSSINSIYDRFVEPALVTMVSGSWLLWTVQRVLTIYGG
jgi:hypothetical protein